MYYLNNDEVNRLKDGILAVFALPFVDDIEDFIWEAIFAYAKQIELIDPLNHIRSKRLFDIVSDFTGWSLKAVQWSVKPSVQFEVVIQRADIFKKQQNLGFNGLSLGSSPNLLGQTLIKHWHDKIAIDSQIQNVSDKRIAILLKSPNRKNYAFYEADLANYHDGELIWQWTDSSQTGLQARNYQTGQIIFRWYPNQKQLFERFISPEEALIFELNPYRLSLDHTIKLLLEALNKS